MRHFVILTALLSLLVGCRPSPTPLPTWEVPTFVPPPLPGPTPTMPTPVASPTSFPAWEGYATPEGVAEPVVITVAVTPPSPVATFVIESPMGNLAVWRQDRGTRVALPWKECEIHPPRGWEITDLTANLGSGGVWLARCLQEVAGQGNRIERAFVPLDACPTTWEILDAGYAKPGILSDGGVLAFVKHEGLRSYYTTLPAISLKAREYYIRCAPDDSCIVTERGGSEAWVVRRIRGGWEVRQATAPAIIPTWRIICNENACAFTFGEEQ